MGVNLPRSGLTPAEETFLRALLWEEGRLLRGPATRTAEERDLSLLCCLEPANRLSPNLHGEALNRIREGACPSAEWPWGDLSGEQVLRLLWSRMSQPGAAPQAVEEAAAGSGPDRSET